MADEKESSFLEEIREFHERNPFEPFVIVMNSGERYAIEAPANFAFGKSRVYYALPASDRLVIMRLSQISSIELAGHTGSKRRRKSA